MAILRAGAKVLSLGAALGLTIMCSTTLVTLAGLPAQAAGDQNLAVQKYNAKDYQGALNELKAVYAKDPKNSLCRYYMALCNQCLARVDEAKKDYKWVVDNGAPNLKAQAQTGLNQLEKVNARTGGSGAVASTPAATTGDTPKGGPDLVERSKDKAGKDASAKDTNDKSTKTGSATATKTAAASSGGNVAKVINFFSDAARASQLMEQSWEEIKLKYPKITFQKVNAGDPLCDKYNVSEFPTVVMLDKNGKQLSSQSGSQTTDAMATAIDNCNDKK
jgi:tetratricopeptide (TPR) repeat protein